MKQSAHRRPARSWAFASSTSPPSSRDPLPRPCSPTSAPTCSRSNCRARAMRLRELAPHKDDVSLWWKVTNRNKKGITLDLRKPDGKALLAQLLADRRRADRELPSRHARPMGHHAGLAAGDQSEAHDPARHRLRPDRALSRPSRLCPRVRGDERLYAHVRRGGRHAAASRLSHFGRDRRIVRRGRRVRRRSIGSRKIPPRAGRKSTAR